MKLPSSALAFLTSSIFVVSPTVALGQQGGGHSSSGRAASTSHSSSARAGNAASQSHNEQKGANHLSTTVVSRRSVRETEPRSDGRESEGRDSSSPAQTDRWLGNDSQEDARPRVVMIGFPRSDAESGASGVRSEEGTGEGNQVQRTTRPAVPLNHAPVPVAPRVIPPSPLGRPLGTPVAHPLVRVQPVRTGPQRALWFLAPPIEGRRIFRRRFFGGFGFFGFGLPFSFGFGPDCNPFWAEPFAFGCNTFGYFSGYGGYGLAPEEESNVIEPSQEQEPEESVFVPPQDQSSPEEIQAEKVLFVLYMKNGALYAITNYWIEDGKLHYLTSYGGENTIDMDEIDLQKTVDVNAKRGLSFTLKPRPDQSQTNQPQQ